MVLPSFVKIILTRKKDGPSYIRPSCLLNSLTIFSRNDMWFIHVFSQDYFTNNQTLLFIYLCPICAHFRLFIYLFIIHLLLHNKLNKPKQIYPEEAHFMRGLEFYPRPGHVRILVDSLVLGEIFLKVLRFLSASVTLSASHSHSLIFNRR